MSTSTTARNGRGTVTRGDIEAKLQQIKGVTEQSAETAVDASRSALIGGVILVILLAYLFGRRRGRKRSTVVEIRRI
jgi:hypothetical protein